MEVESADDYAASNPLLNVQDLAQEGGLQPEFFVMSDGHDRVVVNQVLAAIIFLDWFGAVAVIGIVTVLIYRGRRRRAGIGALSCTACGSPRSATEAACPACGYAPDTVDGHLPAGAG